MKRLGRFRYVVYLAATMIVLVAAGELFLSSSFVRTRLEEQLTAAVGAPVHVGKLNVGIWNGSSVENVEITEGGSHPNIPWLTARTVNVNLSLFDLLKGNTTPQAIALVNPAITLRVNKDGDLLTEMPKPTGPSRALPTITIQAGEITINQEGHPGPFVAGNINADATSTGRVLHLQGSTTGTDWGNWTLSGTVDMDQGRSELKLHTDQVEVTDARLRELPWVSEGVWDEVRINRGVTPVDFQLTVEPTQPGTHYRIDLQPRDTSLRVSSIELEAEHASGKVLIEDDVVRLRDVKGMTAQGTIETEADLDFRGTGSHLDFPLIRVKGVELQALPNVSPWNKLKELALGGKITAEASLDVKSAPHTPPDLTGSGKGTVTDAVVKLPTLPGPVKADKPIKFDFHILDNRPTVRTEDEAPRAVGERGDGESRGNTAPSLPTPLPRGARGEEGSLSPLGGEGLGVREELVLALLTACLIAPPEPAPKAEAPQNLFETDVSLQSLDIAQMAKESGIKLPFPVAGRLSIKMHVAFPLNGVHDLKTYTARGTATIPTLTIAGVDMTNVRAEARLDKGNLTLTELKAQLSGGALSGHGEMRVDGDYPFKASLSLEKLDLEALQKLAPDVRPPLTFAGKVLLTAEARGELGKRTFSASGTAKATDLFVEKARVDDLSFTWEATQDQVRLRDLQLKLYKGAISGSATLPLTANAAGNVAIQIKSVDARALSQAIPSSPVQLDGQISGSIDATMSAAAAGKPREIAGTVDLNAPKLRVQNIAAQRVHGSVSYKGGEGRYDLEGETLGGRFKLEGKIPSLKDEAAPARGNDEAAQPVDEKPDGRFTLENIHLNRLGEALGRPSSSTLSRLRGVLSVSLPFRLSGPQRRPVGTGQLIIRGVGYGDRVVSESLRAGLRLTERELQIRDITASLGEGVLRGLVVVNLQKRENGYFHLGVDGADASRLLAPFPEIADLVSGPVEARLRGTLGLEWRVTGSVVLTRGTVMGVGISQWRLPIDLSYVPAQERGMLDIRDSVAQVASGRANGQLSLAWGETTRLEGSLRFFNADFQGLAPRSNSLRTVAIGKVTGRFDFAAPEFRTLDDLTGVLEAKLAQSQALDLPVLNLLVPFVVPGQSATTFQSGDIRARLGRGTLRIQRLALLSPAVKVVVEGNVGLNGRLDLEATAQTGNLGLNYVALRVIAQSVPTIGPVPVALIARASALLANQVVHLRISGTVKSPSARVEPVSLLTEEAVRLLVTQYLLPVPSQSPLLP